MGLNSTRGKDVLLERRFGSPFQYERFRQSFQARKTNDRTSAMPIPPAGKTLKEWQSSITDWAKRKGFNWMPSDIDTMLLRIHTEVSEAAEAARDNDLRHVAEELADMFIRLANLAEVLGIDLDAEVQRKMQINTSRPMLHGRGRP